MVKATRADAVRESVMQEERMKVKPREKPRQSQFDDVLKEQAKRLQQPSVVRQTETQAATDYGVRRMRQGEDEHHRKEKGRDGEEKREKGEGSETERKTDAKTAEQRVVSKRSVKDDSGGGRGGGSHGGGFAGRRRAAPMKSRLLSGKEGPAMLKAQFAQKLSAAQAKPSRVLTQHVLNQIVKSVRLLVNSAEEKEIRIELHERIFRGLKLRVVGKGRGKVGVHIVTADAAARELFMDNRAAIEGALKRRGIEVDEIAVT